MYGNESRHKVAQAWAVGMPATGANVGTDGLRVFSYAHVVGVTDPNGQKVAYDCHYSVTTAKHCTAFKQAADDTLDHCPTCKARGRA